MGFLDKILGGGAKEVIGAVGGVLDNLITNKEELAKAKLEAEKEINRHFEAIQADSTKQLELEYQDRASARTRESDFVKSTGHADYFQYLIGGLAVCLMIAIVVFLLMKEVPEKNEHVVMLVIGEVLGITTSIYAFYYGSSQGSRNKDRNPTK